MKHRALRAIFAIVSVAVFAAPLVFSYQTDTGYTQELLTAQAQGANDPIAQNKGQQAQTRNTSSSSSNDGNANIINSHCGREGLGIDVASWFAGCLTPGVIRIGGWSLAVSGKVFDFFVHETLNPSYLDQTYVSQTWGTIRDIANMFFVFGIIAVAFMMILGKEIRGTDWKKLATRLVIVALLLNFSLFFSKAIIDAGNLMGTFFLEQANAGNSNVTELNGGDFLWQNDRTTSEVPSTSGNIVSAMRIENMLQIGTINEVNNDDAGKNAFWFAFNILYLAATLPVAYSLFVVGFMMLSRLVWLILLTIASPIAFVSWFIPQTQNLLGRWFKMIFEKSFCVCVYLFVIYVLLRVISVSNEATLQFSTDPDEWNQTLMAIAINVIMVVVFINAAHRAAKNMCGGEYGVGAMALKTITGGAALVAGGALGFAARATLGRAGHRVANTAGSWAYDQDTRGAKGALKRTMGQLALYGGQNLEKQRYGLDKNYNEKLLDETKERRQIYENTRNRTRDKAEADIKSEGKEEYVQNGKLTKAGRDLANKRADTAGQQYLTGIQNSPLDFVLAGGVAAGKETNLNVQKSIEADERATEKSKALRQQQMAIEGDRNERDQATDMGANKALDALRTLEDSLTKEGVAIDKQSLTDLKDAFYASYREITGYNPDGSPMLEMTDQARESANTAWAKVQTRLDDISTKAAQEVKENKTQIEQTTSERDKISQNEAALTTLLKKLKDSDQSGGLNVEEIAPEEREAAEAAGVDITETEEGIKEIKHSVDNLTQLNTAQKQAAERNQTLSKDAQKLQKQTDAILKETKDAAERAVKTAAGVAKRNTKALADTERADINARTENITEERAVLQDYLAEVRGISYETDPFSTDSDVFGR